MAVADLFAELWRHLDQRAAQAIAIDPAVGEALVERVETLLDRIGDDAEADIRDWIDGAEPAQRLMRVLAAAHAIDNWFRPLANRSTAGLNRDLGMARSRLMRHGSLGERARVIPAPPLWGVWRGTDLARRPPDTIAALFDSLLVLPDRIAATAPDRAPDGTEDPAPRTVRIEYRYHSSEGLATDDAIGPDTEWRIGFAPIAQAEDDVSFHTPHRDGRHWYDVEAVDHGTRIEQAVRQLCAAGVHIIVFPEMVMHPDTERVLRRAVATHAADNDNLLMVVAGTRPHRAVVSEPLTAAADGATPARAVPPAPDGRPRNRAIVLDRDGEDLLVQDKLSRWNLNAEQRARFRLDRGGLADGDLLYEYIEEGDAVVVLDSAQFGRLAVMICEDLGRSEPGHWLARNMLVDWIFTPVLDGALHERAWEARDGERVANDGLCRVVVATSLPMTHRQNQYWPAAGHPERVEDSPRIGLCAHYLFDDDRPSVDYVAVPLAGDATKVAVLTLPPIQIN